MPTCHCVLVAGVVLQEKSDQWSAVKLAEAIVLGPSVPEDVPSSSEFLLDVLSFWSVSPEELGGTFEIRLEICDVEGTLVTSMPDEPVTQTLDLPRYRLRLEGFPAVGRVGNYRVYFASRPLGVLAWSRSPAFWELEVKRGSGLAVETSCG